MYWLIECVEIDPYLVFVASISGLGKFRKLANGVHVCLVPPVAGSVGQSDMANSSSFIPLRVLEWGGGRCSLEGGSLDKLDKNCDYALASGGMGKGTEEVRRVKLGYKESYKCTNKDKLVPKVPVSTYIQLEDSMGDWVTIHKATRCPQLNHDSRQTY